MTREVLFEAKYAPADADAVDPRLRSFATHRKSWHSEDATSYYWQLEPKTFHLAPFLRKAIPASHPISWFELPRNTFDKDPQDASLVQLMPDQIKEVVEPGQSITPSVACNSCQTPHKVLPSNPVVRLRLPSPILVTGLFFSDKSSVDIMSAELLRLLGERGLTSGLSTFPVEVEGPADQQYFGVYSRHVLSVALPYGPFIAGDPCPECGRAADRHAFYETFHRPSEEVDWYAARPGHPWTVVTNRVYRFLRNEGAPYVGKPLRGRELQGSRMGWYPDDKDRAFLPERFHGMSDEPVEPIRPDELERLMSPAVPLPTKPKRTRVRKKRD